ncbi:MAG: hypothetical protein ABF258_05270 [Flavobacteriales bacterium]
MNSPLKKTLFALLFMALIAVVFEKQLTHFFLAEKYDGGDCGKVFMTETEDKKIPYCFITKSVVEIYFYQCDFQGMEDSIVTETFQAVLNTITSSDYTLEKYIVSTDSCTKTIGFDLVKQAAVNYFRGSMVVFIEEENYLIFHLEQEEN